MGKKNTVIIDAHAIGCEKGGNETYTSWLVNSLDRINTSGIDVLCVAHKNAKGYFRSGKISVLFCSLKSFFWRILVFGKICFLRKGNKILHSQYFFFPYFGVKNVLTIHDVSWKCFDRFFSLKEKIFFYLVDKCILKADAVITVSETTKKDILRYYPKIDEAKLRCVPNGANHYSFLKHDPLCEKYDIGCPYVLFVSNITNSKNLETSLCVFGELIKQKDFENFKFVVVGKRKNKKYFKDIIGLVEELGITDKVVFIHNLKASSFNEMASIYKGAKALLHFSFYEGFGFVPLEAISLGTVPLVSNCGSIPEILGDDYPLMFDVSDQKAMLKGLVKLLTDQLFEEKILLDYSDKIKEYTWEKAAKKVLAVYEEVLGE